MFGINMQDKYHQNYFLFSPFCHQSKRNEKQKKNKINLLIDKKRVQNAETKPKMHRLNPRMHGNIISKKMVKG
jgi:hypothetical protein